MAVFLGVDFGSRSIEIYQAGRGVVLREPNLAAVDTRGNVVAVGSEALLLRGRAPATVTVRRPFADGELTDFNLVAEMLDRCFEIIAPKQKKHIFAAVKYGLSEKSRELLRKALSDCHTGQVKLVDSAVAALIASGVETLQDESDSYSGNIVCDIGAGSIEASYVRDGELLRTEVINGAGDAADAAICNYIARKYGLAINANTAREAKHKLSLYSEDAAFLTLSGLDKTTGMPRRIAVSSTELLQPAAPQIEDAVEAIERLLANLPHHGTACSIADNILLVGGGALLVGIAEYITQRIGREAIPVSNPIDCVAHGLGAMIEQE